MNKTIQKTGAWALSMALMSSVMPVQIYAWENEHPTEKTETVYAILDSDGSVSDTIVSSWLHDEDGIHQISETLDETDVQNVKTDEEPSISGNTYTWNSKDNDIYYQGHTQKELPVGIQIGYELDGKSVSAKEIAGQSGHLKMTISYTNKESKTVNVNGRAVTIHPSYIAGGFLNLDGDHFLNVQSDNGKIINDGTNEMMAFVNVPGLKETLDEAGFEKVSNQLHLSNQTVIEADVKDFDLGSLMIAISNEMDPDQIISGFSTGSIASDLHALIQASSSLYEGSKQLYDGTVALNTSAKPLTNSGLQIQTLADATVQLHAGTSYLQEGLRAYTQGVDVLDKGNQKLYAIPQGETRVLQGSSSLEQGSKQLLDGLTQMEQQIGALDADSLQNISAVFKQSKETLSSLQEQLASSQSSLSTLKEGLEQAQSGLEAMGQFQTQFQAITNNLNTVLTQDQAKIDAFNTQLQDAKNTQIQSLTSSISSLQSARNALPEDDTTNARGALDVQIQNLQAQLQTVQSLNVQDFSLDGISQFQTQLAGLIQTADASIKQMNTLVDSSQSALSTLKQTMESSAQSMSSLEGTLQAMKQSMPDQDPATLILQLQKGISALKEGAGKIYNGSVTLNEGLVQLQTQSESAIDQINDGSSQFASKNETLMNGIDQLTQGTQALADQKSNLIQMKDGLGSLQNAFDQLQEGAGQLMNGQKAFNDQGMSQLNLTAQELTGLKTVLSEVSKMNKENASFAGSPENAQNTVRFVLRTKEIKSDE